ncbi:unnamed protein product [Toxocara canis]|uniref:VASt domain-containing protein n=1 Tax=Toxocara canis TaxID=6265 RepID=A0A183UC99_TOXCA|nr:unnamed protein product [Toxocara canis]
METPGRMSSLRMSFRHIISPLFEMMKVDEEIQQELVCYQQACMENGAAVSSNELELEDDPTCMFGDCYLKPFSDLRVDHQYVFGIETRQGAASLTGTVKGWYSDGDERVEAWLFVSLYFYNSIHEQSSPYTKTQRHFDSWANNSERWKLNRIL